MLSSVTIVVADDTIDILTSVSEALSLFGYTVHQASDGQSALQLIRRVVPDVAILDIGMPGIDGVGVAREVRSEFGESIRLIAHSGFTQPSDHARAFEAGFDHYVDKPAELEQLLQLLPSG